MKIRSSRRPWCRTDQLERVAEAAQRPNVRAIVLLGSAARGDATDWSDVDVERWFEHDRERLEDQPFLLDGRLVIVSSRTVANVRVELGSAERAIWAVPAYWDMRVLHDPYRDAAAVAAAAPTLAWEPLREDAARAARLIVAKGAEFVLKIQAANERRDVGAALHANGSLIGRCTRAVAIARGVLIRTENEYYHRVQEAAGEAWTRAFRDSHSLDGGDAFEQAAASCRLYRETLEVLDDILDDESRAIARFALGRNAGSAGW